MKKGNTHQFAPQIYSFSAANVDRSDGAFAVCKVCVKFVSVVEQRDAKAATSWMKLRHACHIHNRF